MNGIHDTIYDRVCKRFKFEDSSIYTRATEFCKLRITADQLGARIELSVPLPSAVVELASLDSLKAPMEKLRAMRNSVDYVIADVKSTLVEASCTSGQFIQILNLSFLAKLSFLIIPRKNHHRQIVMTSPHRK
jgi:hypothetical protein